MDNPTVAPETFDLRSKIDGCNKCALAKTRTNILCGQGKYPADIMIISDTPTLTEDKQGRFFVGLEGEVLKDALYNSGILPLNPGDKPISYYVTSIVKCTTQSEDDMNKKPLKSEVVNCSEYLKYEMDFVKPKVIITLGDNAAKVMIGNRSIKIAGAHGGTFFSSKFKCNIIPTYSPSSVVKTPSLKTLMIHDFTKAVSFVNGKVEVGLSSDYKVLKTDEEIEEMIKDIDENYDRFSFDIETNKPEGQYSMDIVCLTLSYDVGKARLIPIMNEHYEEMPIKWKDHLKKLFSLNKIAIAHNGKFDIKVLKQYGIEVPHFRFDTMLAHSLLDENMPHKLKDLSVVYTDMGHYSDGIETYKIANKVHDERYRMFPDSILHPYAMMDSDCTFRLHLIFEKMLKERNLDRLFDKIVMPLQNVLLETEYRGVMINEDHLQQLELDYTSQLKDVKKRVFDAIGHDFNISSVKQLRTVLFDELKLPPVELTKTGPSTDNKTLQKLSEKSPVVKDILKYRELDKLIGTYVTGLQEKAHDSCIHTEYNIAVARTGRLSSKTPNLQNIPDVPEVLDIFVSRPGYTFIYGDYDQMEFKLLGHYCADERMIDGINRGEDVHSIIASEVFEVPIEIVTKDQRDKAKTLNYSIIYGAGPGNVAEQLGITYMEAKELIKRFNTMFPKIRGWMRRMIEFAKMKGYVINSFGRRRNLPHINSPVQDMRGDAERAAINSPVQGLSADLVNFAVVRLEPLVKKNNSFLSLHVHDSLTYEVPDELVEKMLPLIKAEMERDVPGIKVKLTATMKYGKSWGNLKEWNV